MKYKLLLFIIAILLTGCSINKSIELVDSERITYLKSNKSNITSVIIRKNTIGSNDCYNVNIDDAYNAINNIKIVKKSNISVTDNYLSYTFYFSDQSKLVFSFEGSYFIYNKESYVIDNFNNLKLNEEDIVECKY